MKKKCVLLVIHRKRGRKGERMREKKGKRRKKIWKTNGKTRQYGKGMGEEEEN